MDMPYVNAKIISMEPGSKYEGRVYDQYVYLELPDGKIIDVFDDKMLCKPEMTGKIKMIALLAAIVRIKRSLEPIFNVIPAVGDKARHTPSGHGHIFYGKIEGKDEKNHELIINVKYGSIYSDANDQFNDLYVGSFVEIYSVRTDLFKILD